MGSSTGNGSRVTGSSAGGGDGARRLFHQQPPGMHTQGKPARHLYAAVPGLQNRAQGGNMPLLRRAAADPFERQAHRAGKHRRRQRLQPAAA